MGVLGEHEPPARPSPQALGYPSTTPATGPGGSGRYFGDICAALGPPAVFLFFFSPHTPLRVASLRL